MKKDLVAASTSCYNTSMQANEIEALFANILARMDKKIADSQQVQKDLIAELIEIRKEREESIRKCLR